jgi:Icc-related predicted phosphoesterase
MTTILYATDIHGDTRAYDAIAPLCHHHSASIFINGGDVLPKGHDMHTQQARFIDHTLPPLLAQWHAAGIASYWMFGNDDLAALLPRFLLQLANSPSAFEIHSRWLPLTNGLFIRGNPFVPDYPFGLKDWCLRDRPASPPVPTRARSVISTPTGFSTIPSPADFFNARPTMRENLDRITADAPPMDRVIFVGHAPPSTLGLASLWTGQDVGSGAFLDWIHDNQPLLTLSGHIHESPEVGLALTGRPIHTALVGPTTCHQPGQELPHRLTYSTIHIDHDSCHIQWHHHSLIPPAH